MVKLLHSICTLFTLSFYIHTSLISGAAADEDSTSVLLDVSSTLQQTLHVLSSFPTDSTDTKKGTVKWLNLSSTDTISLSLHPRASIHKPLHNNYAALTLSRLNRDSIRLKSIYSNLDLKIPNSLQTPLISGVSFGSGEYFSRIGIGTPVTQYYMVIDTGSDINWLQCKPCGHCYQQIGPVFDPNTSSSYNPVPCGSTQCSSLQVSACRVNSCLYQVSYGDGSFTVGNFATETMSFGNSATITNIPIGCGHNNQGLFIAAAGLIGLGGGVLSLPSQIKATSYSYCLVNRDSSSSSTLEFNSVSPADSIFAPLIRNPRLTKTYSYIGLAGISVGAKPVDIPAGVFKVDGSTGRGGTIIDCGTAVTRLLTAAYNPVRDAFRQLTQNLPSASGVLIFDTCYDFSATATVTVPTVWFVFEGGGILRLKPENYLVPVDSGGKFCFAFAPTEKLSIIGNIQQQGTRVSYDLVKSVVGFSPNKC